MKSPSTPPLPLSEGGRVSDAVRVQILATEHWSLLATRSMSWNEAFSRAGAFLTVLSAALVALALVAQATGFGPDFRLFALVVLPIVLLLGLGTYTQLTSINDEDIWLVIGMNRLRHAYLELAPELEPYFITGHHDDVAGIEQTYTHTPEAIGIIQFLSSTPALIGVIDAVVAGVLVTVVAGALGAPNLLAAVAGAAGGVIWMAVLVVPPVRRFLALRRDYRPHFPDPQGTNTPQA